MIKRVCKIFILAAAIIVSVFQTGLLAADISVGATAWYTAWKYDDDSSENIKYNPSILYGPALSSAFTQDLSMSFVFLYGEFDMESGGSDNMWLKRFDSDLALNYRISSYFKVFAGAKFIGFTWPDDGKHLALGPGVGLSSVLPVAGNFFILGNISALYLRGKEEGVRGETYSADANEYGGNASLSLAYYMAAASTTISIGGRYQQIKIDYTESSEIYFDSMSRFYGVTLTAVYTFNL